MTSPYLRRAALPLPPYLRGDRVITGSGLGTVRRTYWAVPAEGAPHWRIEADLIDGGWTDCNVAHARRPAILAVDEYLAAAE